MFVVGPQQIGQPQRAIAPRRIKPAPLGVPLVQDRNVGPRPRDEPELPREHAQKNDCGHPATEAPAETFAARRLDHGQRGRTRR